MRLIGALSPDVRAPTGTITFPANGGTISGTSVNLTIAAADDHKVAGVQWKIDGVNVGAEVTASPFTKNINTSLYSDGSHTLQAVVRDVVNHTTTVTITAVVNNNPGAGSFSGYNPTPGRRPYDFSSGNFASPNYIDTPGGGWDWPGNLYSAHYKVQMRYTADQFEAINGPQSLQNHMYALALNGVEIHDQLNDPVANLDTGYFDISDAAFGAVSFHDWAAGSGAGGTAYVGNVILYWRYVWTH